MAGVSPGLFLKGKMDYQSINIRPSIMGQISTLGGTTIGMPVDRIGFNKALAFYTIGNVSSTASQAGSVTFKIQESNILSGTGSDWTDITNGSISQGSWAFTSLAITNSNPHNFYSDFRPEILCDGNRKRYLRFHGTISGTIGLIPKMFACFMMAEPVDSNYVVSGAYLSSTGNADYTKIT